MEKTRNTEEEKKMGQKWVKEEHKASTSRVNTGLPVNTGKLSPMMQEYCKTKEKYKDCVLFYRLGDFYEMFFDDALLVSKELELTLTGKDCGLEERAPMCGIPFHASEVYIKRLIEKGHKVAICEQVEDPKKAKGLVKREVIRVVTPGTTLDATSLDESKNNYLMSIVSLEDHFGCAIADITTGDCFLTEVDRPQKLLDEINKFVPAEIICNDAFFMSGVDTEDLKERLRICIFPLDNWYFDDSLCQRTLKDHFHVNTLEGLGLQDYDSGVIAAGALFQYLNETQKTALSHMATIHPYTADKFMLIDSSTRRNLELVETLREKQKRGSLLWVLDKTKTAMGARTLRGYVEQPLIDAQEINRRLAAVEELTQKPMLREEIREYLNPIYDLERLVSRISYQSANPRDMVSFASSLEMLPFIRQILKDFEAPVLKQIYEDMDPLEDVTDLIKRAIVEDPPLAQKDGGIIREGFNADVDKYRRSRTDGKKWLAELEAREKERTGIKNLKIKYNRVFGYSLEVTNSFKDQVPDNYVRKQTLANAERYITQELKDLEDLILGAEDRLYALEYELFADVREKVGREVVRIQKTAKAVAALDVFASLALVAERNNFVKPKINENGVLDIKGGRHPVVEQMIENDMFIANDTYLDNQKKRVSVITGPNMAGKSTYMRQVALIAIMAQIGSFVPASSARIGIVDRLFTRVGASDDLASGTSTFMLEMNEVAYILKNATKRSLIIYDEIGRGTSTFDGMSIARAVAEYTAGKKLGARTLFATHYHELTALADEIPGVVNYSIAAKKKGDELIFLRRIVKGAADDSYGIEVAKLAGVPGEVIRRARVILGTLEKKSEAADRLFADDGQEEPDENVSFEDIGTEELRRRISELDMDMITPRDALELLYDLKKLVY